jgi:hypothetical protein
MPERFDIETITLGEAVIVEQVSGEEFGQLVGTPTGARLVGLFLAHYRKHGDAQVWSEIVNQPVQGASKLVSRLLADSPSPTPEV